MRYRYTICDVFTETRFGGNQLAVLPEAEGLSDEQMQQIAREFNFSETTFVFPAEQGHSRKVRIFTPTVEIPFAGHPNIGTAFVLATAGAFQEIATSITVTFEEAAGIVPISIHKRPGQALWCELRAPQALSLGGTLPAERMASLVSPTAEDITTTTHPPQVASVGIPFLFTELKNRAALGRARVVTVRLEALAAEGIPPDIHLYTRSQDEFDIHARMFAPLEGVPEDPATGSAACALAGLLTHYDEKPTGQFSYRIAQGIEMGRPSILDARAEKLEGGVTATWIGGSSVLVAEGYIEVG
ncbi:MAG: PhzF family phenazine biosynthesis protein [Planctomycetes bacterium]|nr:PhzF family phenazine biosynthesis protein [Planctomycetota bacterium]